MTTETQSDRISRGLIRLGYREELGRSRRYRVFAAFSKSYYVGKSGAFRVGPTIADSVPTSAKFKKAILELGASNWLIETPQQAWTALNGLLNDQ